MDFSRDMFRCRTWDPFASLFRCLLIPEPYRNPGMMRPFRLDRTSGTVGNLTGVYEGLGALKPKQTTVQSTGR